MTENIDHGRICIGERVTITRRGKRGIWTAEFWSDDQHRRQSLRTRDKRTAETKARKIEVQLAEGELPRVRAAAKIRDAIDAYILFVKTNNRSSKTIGKYEHDLAVFELFCYEERVVRLDQFSMAHFDRYRNELGKSPNSLLKNIVEHFPKNPSDRKRIERAVCLPRSTEVKEKNGLKQGTINDYSDIVKQLYNFSECREMIVKNPIKEYKIEKAVRYTKPCPTLTQLLEILEAATPRLARQIAFLAFTGLRSQNLKNLKKKDVDLCGGWIHIANREGLETKTRIEWKVPIHPELERYLRAVPLRPGDWFFTAEPSRQYPQGDHQISQKRLNEDFQAVLRRLGLPAGRKSGFVIHSLRRFFETTAINAGVPARVVDRWTGHFGRDRSMGNLYYFFLTDDTSQAHMKQIPFGNGKPVADPGE